MHNKLTTAMLAALLAVIFNCRIWAQAPAPREVADSPAAGTVGVVPDPCAVLDWLPPDAAGQSRRVQQDFSQQCRYARANQSLPPASAHRVVLMGDSITELWGQMDPGFFRGDTINRGISGQTTDQMLGRFRADVIDLKPEVVQILAGTNDVAGNTGPTSLRRIENNIESMVELARTHRIRVVLGSILPAAQFGWRPWIEPIDSIRALNAWMKDYAANAGLVFVDFHSALAEKDLSLKSAFTADGVHPNAAGYAVMRPLAERGIMEARRKLP